MTTLCNTACCLSLMAACSLCIHSAFAECAGDATNSAVVTEYLFFEGTGTTAINTGSDEDDGNATLIKGASYSTDAPPSNDHCGWSIEFPSVGTGTNTPAVETAGTYDPLAGAEAFTIMAWVRRESIGSGQNTSARIVSDTSSLSLNGSTAGFEFRFSGAQGALNLRINGNEVGTSVGGVPPDSDAWHHVAVVYDGTRPATNTLSRNVHFYVDGIQRGDGNTLTNVLVAGNTNPLTVGNSSVSRGVGNLMVGKIDDVLILSDYAPEAVGNGKTNESIYCFMNADDDIEPPIITCPEDLFIPIDENGCTVTNLVLGYPDVSDNCEIASVTNDAPTQFEMGVTLVRWTAIDVAENTTVCTQSVTVVDVTPPSIQCPPPVVIELEACEQSVTNLVIGEPMVSDNCGIAGLIMEGSSEYFIGTTSVVWRVWDTAGNTNACVQQITITPSTTGDCDGDGLTDWEEINLYHSDPNNPSSAGDGLSDGWKVQYGFDPTNAVPAECRPTYW